MPASNGTTLTVSQKKAIVLLNTTLPNRYRELEDQTTALEETRAKIGDKKFDLALDVMRAVKEKHNTNDSFCDAVEEEYKEWWEEFGLAKTQIHAYLNHSRLVLDEIPELGSDAEQELKNSISVRKLDEIMSLRKGKKIPKNTVNKLVKWLDEEHDGILPSLPKVREWVADTKNPPKKHTIPPIEPVESTASQETDHSTMENRLADPTLGGMRLLGLAPLQPDIIKLVGKQLMHTYHPDKGGDPEVFARIKRAMENAAP